jgi:PhnB protein
MKLMAHLHFKGNCREAFEYYVGVFGGRIEFAATYADTPDAAQFPAAERGRIAHARVDLNGQYLLGCDPPADRYVAPQGYNVMALVDTAQEAERVFTQLAAGGTIVMPFGQTFWAYRFGMCTDRFGIPWMVNCEKAP